MKVVIKQLPSQRRVCQGEYNQSLATGHLAFIVSLFHSSTISIALCVCTFLFSGCVKFYTYEEYRIKVIDAELNQPVEGVSVSVKYHVAPGLGGLSSKSMFFPRPPNDMTVITDIDGLAAIKKAKDAGMYLDHCMIWAEGYNTQNAWFTFFSFPLVTRSEGLFIISIYRMPPPKIELVVPDGYKGPVGIKFLQSNDPITGEPGQRLFTYHLQPENWVGIPITPLIAWNELPHLITHNRAGVAHNDDMFVVKREDGDSIIWLGSNFVETVDPKCVAFRWVCDDDITASSSLFVIGTEHDRDVLYKKLYPENRNRLDRDAFNAYFREPSSTACATCH